jgi:uncharacterized repeat protein (TIGR01451 family)
VLKPLYPIPASRHHSLRPFSSRCLTLVCSLIVVLSGILTSASAQTKPVDSQPADPAAAAQSLSGDASQTQTAPVADPGQPQGFIHIVPFGKVGSAVKNGFAPGGAHLTYWGGPVISNIHAIVVLWGPNVNTAIGGTPGIAQFFGDITTSRYYDLLSEYNTVGITGAGAPATSSNQVIGHGVFDGQITITPSLCPGPTVCTVTDAQVAAELDRQITAGSLPQPVLDSQGNVDSFYMIYFPPGVTIDLDALTKSCVQFCAYHSNTPSTLVHKLVPYGVEPDFAPPSACSRGCGNNAALFDNVTEVTSHEMSEAVTDALVGSASATVIGPPLAWYDPNPAANPLGEIGDICVGQPATVSAGNTTYVVQQEFSNLQGDCVSAPPVFNMTTPTAGAGPSLPFNVTLTIQSSAGAFTLGGYTGTVHFTSSDPQAIVPADYTFSPTDSGSHIFSFTLKAQGDQTISVVDTHSGGFTGSATVNVNTTPDLTIAKSHTGNLSVGQTGAAYSIAVSNVGHGPTSGTVSVVDALPGGLTATAINGTGWTCTLGTLTCTRSDAVAAGASYPAITLTVNVAANAPSLVTNTASVSGGGDTNTANNTANDPTTILAPDLMVAKGHFGPINGNFFQGETGATYTITVQNPGNLATSGTVTMVDTPPATGLNPTAISGTGWNCTLATLTCTRSDVLAAFSSYPQITVTVDVPLGAPATVINTATVSGGGEINTANDVTQDVTIILPPPAPDLSAVMFHGNNFVQGQSGTYFIIVNNLGTAITSAPVTVADTLPAGLTATAMSGPGWSCTVAASPSCTRSDALNFNGTYPIISLTVDVAANAPASVTNTATVSGGGDTNLANNSVSDPTVIAPPLVDLSANIAESFSSLFQGATNQNYEVFINNSGNVPSSGVVTVTNTLSTGLTATAISGAGWNCTLSTLTCTRSDALVINNGFPTINITFNIAANALSNELLTAIVSGGGDGNAANNTGNFPFIVASAIQIQPTVGSLVVNAGQPAVFGMTISGQAFVGAVALSCSGLPTASSCTFNPSGAGPGLIADTMTITTTARSAAAGGIEPLINRLPFLLAAILSFAILLVFGHYFRRDKLRGFKPAFGLAGLLLACFLAIAGCGGGSNPPPPPPPNVTGTPAGTFSITITGTSPTNTASSQVTLTVR